MNEKWAHKSASTAAEPPPPESPSPISALELPPIAAKADDLEAIKKAVDDAASVGGGLWLSYLFVMFYLAIAAGAVTHADLFLETPVKLPFLGVELPLLVFFFLAPILFIVVHAYTLVHLVMLTEKAKRFHHALYDSRRNVDASARESLQWQLPSNIFIQFLVGPPGVRGGLFGVALRAIAWITLVIAPVLLLLTMQVQFLPFHSPFITWTQRIALLVDLLLLGWLWRKVLSGRELGGPFRASWAWPVLGAALGLAVLVFSWAVATFPGEPQEELVANCSRCAILGSLRDRIFQSPVDPTNRRRRLPFSNTLVLTGFNVLEGLGIDDPEKAKWRDYIFRARGRDLKGARFDFANLPRVDFTGANLQGASLDSAQLDRISLDAGQLQGASLENAQLKAASLKFAQLGHARLKGAQLHGASLASANLQDADIEDAQLQEASLDNAQLQNAYVNRAQLQGASLNGAHLQGAKLSAADLRGASLSKAELQGALLDGAHLQGASLENAALQAASLSNAQLQGASLANARLQAASLQNAGLQATSLFATQLQGAKLSGATLKATDLSEAFLWRSDGGPQAAAIRFDDTLDAWGPFYRVEYTTDPTADRPPVQRWGDEAYRDLVKIIELLPQGARDLARHRIGALDCTISVWYISSCDARSASIPTPSSPPSIAAWWKVLVGARVDGKTFARALSQELKALACTVEGGAVYVVRGPGFADRLAKAGSEAYSLIDDLANKDGKNCPVAAALTDVDRANLLSIKRDTIKEAGQ
jgi:uncharacterized protein YjbI with pentapeptide repeats